MMHVHCLLFLISEDEQFNDEKTYLIKQIKELHALPTQAIPVESSGPSTG